ncbi:MAG: hypothetical protein KJ706_05280, partial [Candidatus Omnitrophica bacterium]|nr:hypothetical protein [Candidatus Omnitrophota bacterium]
MNRFLQFSDQQILETTGKITQEMAQLKAEEEYLKGLDAFASVTYPIQLDTSKTYDVSKIANLNKYLDKAKAELGIEYEIVDGTGESVAFYNATDNKVYINKNLVAIATGLKKRKTSRAFQIFINDIFTQAVLYAQGKDKWTVWQERADYFKEHPEEYLLLADLLTNGAYDLIDDAPKSFNADKDYLTILRINTNLRKLQEAVESDKTGLSHRIGRRYFQRLERLKGLPGTLNMSVMTNWAMTKDQIEKAREFFIRSDDDIRLIDTELKKHEKKIQVAVIVGMHAEKIRLEPAGKDNPNGEDSLRTKVKQLEELFKDTNIDWELIFVAHPNSPDKSGKVVEDLTKRYYPGYYKSGKVRSIYMTGPVVGKGGKVEFGLADAISETEGHIPSDIALYTDADVTVDMRQTALLMKAMLLDEKNELRLDSEGNIKEDVVAFGSRVPSPPLPKDGGFAMPGLDPSPYAEENVVNAATKAINIKYLFPQLTEYGSKETQCGFKAYPRKILEKILPKTKDTTFSFDTELFTHALNLEAAIKEIGIFWSDSAPEASGTNVTERWRMFKSWIDQYKRLAPKETMSEQDLKAIEKLVDEGFNLAGQKKDTTDIAKKIVKIAGKLPKHKKKEPEIAPYPLGLEIDKNASLDSAKTDNLNMYLDNSGYGYELESFTNGGYAVYDADKKIVKINRALAQFTPAYGATDASRAFAILINDMIQHALLYAQGKDKWTVWQERADYFKEHPEEYLLLADLLTN